MIRIGHFSDPHVAPDKLRARARLTAAARFFQSCDGLDLVLCTGDRTVGGAPEEKAVFDEITAGLPGLVSVRGNHDARSGEPSEAPQDVDLGEARLLALDSSIPTFDDGLIGRRQLAWLDDQLGEDDRPTLVALHHPPARLHTMADSWPLQDAHDLQDLIRRHPHIVGVLAGHAHSATVTSIAGVPLVVCPALVNHSFLPEEGLGVTDAAPPVVAVHYLDGMRLITHFRVIL